MNWDNNNSGPWGKGKKSDPSPSSGKKTTDENVVDFDLNKFLKDSKSTLRDMLDSGNGDSGRGKGNGSFSSGNNAKVFVLLIGIVTLLWLATGFYKVNAEEEGVVMRFGKYHRTTTPGLNYHLPYPIENVIKIAVTRINQEEIGSRVAPSTSSYGRRRAPSNSNILKERLMLTGDINIVDVNFVVQWRIDNARDYLFNVRDQYGENTVKNAAESAMREVIGKVPLNAALAQERFAIEQEAKKILQNILDSYASGIFIERVQMQDSDPPTEVVDAFRSVEAARAEKETLINEAEKYKNKILPEARGEAERILQDADAYKQKVVAIAEGNASRFVAVLNKYRTAKEVTKKRIYLETMEEVFQDMDKIIIDGKQGSGVLPYLPLSALDGSKNTKGGQ